MHNLYYEGGCFSHLISLGVSETAAGREEQSDMNLEDAIKLVKNIAKAIVAVIEIFE